MKLFKLLSSWLILYRHFLLGLVHGDRIESDARNWARVYWLLILIAVGNSLSAWSLFSIFAEHFSIESLIHSFSCLLSIQMIISAMVVLLAWSGFFLHPWDWANLAHLPPSTLVMVSAKISVIITVIMVLNLIHLFSVIPIIMGFTAVRLDVSLGRYLAVLPAYFTWANLWVFFLFLALLGLTMAVSGLHKRLVWLLHLLRFSSLALLVGTVFYLPQVVLSDPAEIMEGIDFLLLRPAFAVGREMVPELLSPGGNTAWINPSWMGASFIVFLLLSLVFVRLNFRSKITTAGAFPIKSKLLAGFFAKVPFQRAGDQRERFLFTFFRKTFFRNHSLWLYLALLWAPAGGLVLLAYLSAGPDAFSAVFSGQERLMVLAGSVLGFLLPLFAMLLFRQKMDAGSEWIFSLMPGISQALAYRSSMKFFLVFFLAPFWPLIVFFSISFLDALAAVLFALCFWPFFAVLNFFLFMALNPLIPFTGILYRESPDNTLFSWPVYLLGGMAYVLAAREAAMLLLRKPVFAAAFGVFVLFVLIRIMNNAKANVFDLRMEDETIWS